MEFQGINRELGLHNCSGNEKIFQIVLQSVYDESKEKIELMKAAIQSEDYKTYTILAHGLKSVALSIGAEDLSSMAKQHEMAGKEGNTDFIKTHSGELILQYQELAERILESI